MVAQEMNNLNSNMEGEGFTRGVHFPHMEGDCCTRYEQFHIRGCGFTRDEECLHKEAEG